MAKIPREQRGGYLADSTGKLSLRRRCELLGMNKSTLYYQGKAQSLDDVAVLNSIRDIWMRYPFYGYRRITQELRSEGVEINRKRVQRLMRLGGICALYPGPNTSRRNKLHAIHPYLLRDMRINEVNQAWMVDITYLRMAKGFMYLVALIDVHSRYVVGWSLSNTLDTSGCVEALKMALVIGKPDIINSDQGCQFTSDEWVNYLHVAAIKVSMTGKGRCLDNVYIERFWRSFKQEEFYLNEYDSVKVLRKAISAYIEFYNHKRWHQSLGYKTPGELFLAPGKEVCGYMHKPFGADSPLRDVWTSQG